MPNLVKDESKIKAVFSRDSLLAIIALFTARIIMSFTPILLRLSSNEIGPNASGFWREAVALIFLGALGGVSVIRRDRQFHEQKPYNRRIWLLLVVMGIVGTCLVLLFAWSVSQTRISNFAVIESLTPLFPVLGGWLLFGQLFVRWQAANKQPSKLLG
ncbi:DMT family transporter [Okeania sp. SIO2B3]|uniref:DMT family transporter n=1 Tax=Okeania sp. SIO2B3 TaxID=2607784 RepID=UPI0013C1C626|nr:DMT family transporter [Okeania sp. SIO2B3]NET44410.1 DMT family transporter [Okeania sp. SIO2B3]